MTRTRQPETNYDIDRPQDPPFAIQLEPVEGCTLACSFCGLQSIRNNGADAASGTHGTGKGPYRFMDWRTVERIAKDAAALGWNPRWEFAMHGEPTLHKDLPIMISDIRVIHPRGYIVVTSNGSGFLGVTGLSKVKTLFDAGLNTLALDLYNHAPFKTNLETLIAACEETALLTDDMPPVHYYPRQSVGNPHKRHNGKMITVISDISDNTSGTHKLTNQGGNSGDGESVEQRCAKPFRELSVRWDGNVALCCDDWKGQYKIGNVNDMLLNDIWQHPRFVAARRKLYFAQRDFGPCDGCNVRTFRNGLLPDKYGQATMPLPSDRDKRYIREALGGKVFSIKLAKGD
jgi:radical SAM protein with 4Fe4S-binding SPASM domain